MGKIGCEGWTAESGSGTVHTVPRPEFCRQLRRSRKRREKGCAECLIPYQSPLPSPPRARELEVSPLTLPAAADAKLEVKGEGMPTDDK